MEPASTSLPAECGAGAAGGADVASQLIATLDFSGSVCVQAGNTVNIKCCNNAVRSRQFGFDAAQALLATDAKGFNADDGMQLVKPKTPFKPNSTEHWPDMGLHCSVALPDWKAEDGTPDVVTRAMEKVAGRQIQLAVDPTSWHFLEGTPANDQATGLVFYLAAFLDEPSQERVAQLRTELGLGAIKNNPHLSLAGVAPSDGNFIAFRQRFCRPRPPAGALPVPYPQIAVQHAFNVNECVAMMA